MSTAHLSHGENANMASWASNKSAIYECSNRKCLKNTLSRSNQHQSLLILACDLHDVIFYALNLTVSHKHTHVACKQKTSCYAWQWEILKHHIICIIYNSLTFSQRNIQHVVHSPPAHRKEEQFSESTHLPRIWEYIKRISRDQCNADNSPSIPIKYLLREDYVVTS